MEALGIYRGRSLRCRAKAAEIFRQAHTEPNDYEHVISFYNGSVAVIISQDRPGSSNSLTLSWLLIDEAKFINYDKLKDETLPANGGIKSHFGRHSFNHSILILSDMPQAKKGSWFLHYREKMDTELIATIEGTVYEIWRVRERIRQMRDRRQPIPAYLRGHLRRLDRQLNQMRSVAVYYREYSSIENLQLLGENYIKQMKRDLTPLTFQTSILCRRIGIAKDGFYSSMREGISMMPTTMNTSTPCFRTPPPKISRLSALLSRHLPMLTLTPTRLSASVWTTTPTSTGLSPDSRVAVG